MPATDGGSLHLFTVHLGSGGDVNEVERLLVKQLPVVAIDMLR
jgi:hypothetical protein